MYWKFHRQEETISCQHLKIVWLKRQTCNFLLLTIRKLPITYSIYSILSTDMSLRYNLSEKLTNHRNFPPNVKKYFMLSIRGHYAMRKNLENDDFRKWNHHLGLFRNTYVQFFFIERRFKYSGYSIVLVKIVANTFWILSSILLRS